MTQPTCSICGNHADRIDPLYGPSGGIRAAFRVHCPTCGTYDISEMMSVNAKRLSAEDRYRLSAITRQASQQGKPIELLTGNTEELLRTMHQPGPVEQADLVLEYLAARMPAGGKPVPLASKTDYPIAHAHGPEGLQFIVNSMAKDGLIERTDQSALPHYRITMAGYRHIEDRRRMKRTAAATGWAKVDRGLEEIQRRLEEATIEEQFQAVALLCREALISLAQAVYDAARHGTIDGKEASSTDAKRMLEAFIAAELPGKPNEEARAHAKAAVQLAVALQHDRAADFRAAAVCVEATAFLARLIAIIAGKRDP